MRAEGLRRIGFVTAAVFFGYTAVLFATRPWHERWGATDEEIGRPLPGDEISEGALTNHAITIKAPREKVWPWLVQIGQDRAGFYSYTVLENLVLAGIHNSDRVVPEWQSLADGDHVRLASKRVYGDFPLLRVSHFEDGRCFVLNGWGAFVLEPIDDKTTRLSIRTHRRSRPLAGRVIDFYLGQPAHFIMERGMLRGIKKRAERT